MTIQIMIVDDHAIVREGLRLSLERQPGICIVGEASNGHEAVGKMVQTNPDIIVMDISMPDLNGIEATRQIMERSPQTRVIILSMHSSAEFIFRALQVGAAGYVLKDAGVVELIAAIHAVLRGESYLCRQIKNIVVDKFHWNHKLANSSPLESLSNRECQVLQLLVEGKMHAEIAQTLYLSPKSIATYRMRIMRKLGLHDFPGLIKFAIHHGLTGLL